MTAVAVLGAGITGLACAHQLRELLPDADIRTFEASDRAGGLVRTHREQGFICEAGPNGFLNAHPSTLALAVSAGLGNELITACESKRKRFILHGGRLRRFPDSPSTFFSSDLLSAAGKARVLLEPLVPRSRRSASETVGQFARRRLGSEGAALLVDPVVSGIYAGDSDRLGAHAALPQLARLDGAGRSLLAAFLHARRQEGQPEAQSSPATIGRRRLVSLRSGIGRLAEAVASGLGESLHLSSRVRSVKRDDSRWLVTTEDAGPAGNGGTHEFACDAVVCALPAPEAASVLSCIPFDVRGKLASVPSAPLSVVAIGLREADVPHDLDGFGYLVSSREASSVLGVTWCSSMFPGHRSDGSHVLLQAILGGARDTGICDRDDDELIDITLAQLQSVLGITAAPVLARTFRHERGLPQYEVSHPGLIASLEEAASTLPGLVLAGSAYRGVGVNACTADAERAASRVASWLHSRAPRTARGLPRSRSGVAASDARLPAS